MKRLIVFVLLVFVSSTWAMAGGDQLKNFEAVMTSLKAGKNVKVVINYPLCKLISDNEVQEKIPEAIGGMTIDTWEYFAENAVRNKVAFVVTSTNHLIQNPKGDGFVHNYVKIKILADNTVKITAKYLNVLTFEEQMDENFFGEINDGKNDAAVYFYELN